MADYAEDELCPSCLNPSDFAEDDACRECIEKYGADNGEGTEDSEPNEDDLTTSDGVKFYQYGKLAFTVSPIQDRDQALIAYMDKEQYSPNCWNVSDHGNPHLIDLSKAYALIQAGQSPSEQAHSFMLDDIAQEARPNA